MDEKQGSGPGMSSLQLCVLVHGMGGTCGDWDTWLEVLAQRHPDWVLLPLRSLDKGCKFLADSLDVLADMAADEIAAAARAEHARSASGSTELTLHCIGHSMGGLIIRGALPKLLAELQDVPLELGHYISLSSPHMGIQASFWVPSQAWRNLCWLSRPLSKQLLQLAVQDVCSSGRPYLVELSDPGGDALQQLGRFRHRTCVTLACGDPLISLPSGSIDPDISLQGHGFLEASFWTFDEHFESGGSSPFEKKLKAVGKSAAKLAGDTSNKRGLFSEVVEWLVYLWALIWSLCRRVSTLSEPAKAQKYGKPSEASLSASKPEPPFSPSQLSWQVSKDLTCKYPLELLDGLTSVPWRRVVARAHHWPFPRNMHVFLIGKRQEQFAEEHLMSRQCIECLAEILAD
eukprot:TRINITY_DN40206_c0_g1_i1.p1 TRINITY_DN40206_c0_g1~~TRINITY_DN40206_c0_g1_i1.p1  ORF type:complete len:402 (+),score=82.99 TRINITY_DN40206_c0_g1_i1:29-1234(+)